MIFDFHPLLGSVYCPRKALFNARVKRGSDCKTAKGVENAVKPELSQVPNISVHLLASLPPAALWQSWQSSKSLQDSVSKIAGGNGGPSRAGKAHSQGQGFARTFSLNP